MQSLEKNDSRVVIYFSLLFIYLIVNMNNVGETQGGGLLNQIVAGITIIYCTFCSVLSKKMIPPNGVLLYRLLQLLLYYIIVRIIVMGVDNPKLALASIRDGITIIFWGISLLFCIKNFWLCDSKKLNVLIIIFIVLSFINFIYSIVLEKRYFQSIDLISAVNAAGSAYMLIPLILIALKGRARIIAYLICLIICAWSQKRQCLLGFAIISIFLIYDLAKSYFRTFNIMGVFYLLLALLFSSAIISRVFSGIIERQEYLNSKGDIGNGRNVLRLLAWQGYQEAPFSTQLFGGGPGTGGRYIEQRLGSFYMPHCGFVEVLCDYGLVGSILYGLFFLAVFRMALSFPRKSIARKILLGVFFSWVMVNCFSHAGNIWLMCFCMTIGCLLYYGFVGDERVYELD